MKKEIKRDMLTAKTDFTEYTLEYVLFADTFEGRTLYSISSAAFSGSLEDSEIIGNFTDDPQFAEFVYNAVLNNRVFPVHLCCVADDLFGEDTFGEQF